MKHIDWTAPIFLQRDCPNFSASGHPKGRGLSLVVIGLTGGIATGKTTVAKMFKKLGCKILSADEIAHRLIKPKKICWIKIVEYFGKNILRKDNTIDRKKLAKIIFSHKNKMEALNKITHPRIIDEIKKEIARIKVFYRNRKRIIVVEAPLLIEANALNLVDKVIVVIADRKTQIQRLLKKNSSLTKSEAEKIIGSQMRLSRKIRYADYIIDNNSTLTDTKKQVKELFGRLTKI